MGENAARLAMSKEFLKDNHASIVVMMFKVLSKDNQENWSVIMKIYQVSKDIWDGIVSSNVDKEKEEEKVTHHLDEKQLLKRFMVEVLICILRYNILNSAPCFDWI